MKNKITSLILVAALALLANIAYLGGSTLNNTTETDSIEICWADYNWYEF